MDAEPGRDLSRGPIEVPRSDSSGLPAGTTASASTPTPLGTRLKPWLGPLLGGLIGLLLLKIFATPAYFEHALWAASGFLVVGGGGVLIGLIRAWRDHRAGIETQRRTSPGRQ